jgi:hypothetical protein
MPELHPDNERLFDCFTLCDMQLRVGFTGAYALDWGIVRDVAVAMGIETDAAFYTLLRVFDGTLVAELKSGEKDGE